MAHPFRRDTDFLPPELSQSYVEIQIRDRLVFNDPSIDRSVFKVDNIPDAFVAACVQSLTHDASFALDLATLNHVVRTKGLNETHMYPSIMNIFNAITDFGVSGPAAALWNKSTVLRRARNSSSQVLLDDTAMAYPGRKPNMSFAKSDAEWLWRLCDGFVEVKKALSPRGPPAALCSQVADTARIHLASRPFQLHTLFLCFCGTNFYVSTWDRGGGVFSQVYDICDQGVGFETFVRVMLQMTRGLVSDELGQDPNVSPLSPSPPLPPAIALRLNEREIAYPRFKVSFDKCSWTTVGYPIFQSLSYIGRGTSVWLVYNPATGDERILKSAWRADKRAAEIDIYKAFKETLDEEGAAWPVGVARFETGGDVIRLTDSLKEPLRISDLRPGIACTVPNNPVLHRVILTSIGRPLWRYSSEKQLLLAFRDAILGHRELYGCGFLHRDISAGNVLLAEYPEEDGCHGFVTDLEFAKRFDTTPPPSRAADSTGENLDEWERSPRNSSAVAGPAMSGTAQFMAMELLRHYLPKKKRSTLQKRPTSSKKPASKARAHLSSKSKAKSKPSSSSAPGEASTMPKQSGSQPAERTRSKLSADFKAKSSSKPKKKSATKSSTRPQATRKSNITPSVPGRVAGLSAQSPVIPTMVQDARHDLESFVWVLIYAILKHEQLELASEIGDIKDAKADDIDSYQDARYNFHRYFGDKTISAIADRRQAMATAPVDGIPEGVLRDVVENLCYGITLYYPLRRRDPRLPLTYEYVLAQVNAALKQVEASENSEDGAEDKDAEGMDSNQAQDSDETDGGGFEDDEGDKDEDDDSGESELEGDEYEVETSDDWPE